MPKLVEEGILHPSRSISAETRGSDLTTDLLRRTIPDCSACSGPLEGHSYRFYACHPVASDHGPSTFLQAIHAEEWATVQATQMPALDQPLYVLYAIACPHPPEGSGMVALLLTHPDAQTPDILFEHLALTPQSMAALRAQCPTCPWITFSALLQIQQDPV